MQFIDQSSSLPQYCSSIPDLTYLPRSRCVVNVLPPCARLFVARWRKFRSSSDTSVDAAAAVVVQDRLLPSPFAEGQRQHLLPGGEGVRGSPVKPVALRPRPTTQPGRAFEATAPLPYSSIFARGRDEEHAKKEAYEDGGALPLRDRHAALRSKPGGRGAWTPPPAAPSPAAGAATAAAAADAGSSLLVEPGSVGVMSPSPPPPQVSRTYGRREEGRPRRTEAGPAASGPAQRPHPSGTAGQGRSDITGVRGGGEEGAWSVGSSSTSTLPPLDQELSELLER